MTETPAIPASSVPSATLVVPAAQHKSIVQELEADVALAEAALERSVPIAYVLVAFVLAFIIGVVI